MKPSFTKIEFYSEKLECNIVITHHSGLWFFEFGSGLYNEGVKTFDKCYAAARKAEKEMIYDLQFEEYGCS